jgi:methionyl-tRNA formyltransferase
LKILFVGTPDFALESLKAVIAAGHEVVGAVTAPDRPKGRGMKMAMSEVKEYCLAHNIPVFQPEKIKTDLEFLEEVKKLNADIACVVVYGKLLPKSFLDLFKCGCVNVHPSLLPKYRGSAPIQWAIINGDEKTGVCTMYLDVGMDDGDVILREETKIQEDENAGDVWNRLSTMGAKLLVQTLDDISHGIIKRTPQEGEVVLAPKLDKNLSKINWEEKSAKEIKNLVRGLTPGMGTYTFINNKQIKFWKVDAFSYEEFLKLDLKIEVGLEELKNKPNGEVILALDKKGLFIKAKDGILSVLEIQGENSKKMNIKDFLRGNKIEVGEKFS